MATAPTTAATEKQKVLVLPGGVGNPRIELVTVELLEDGNWQVKNGEIRRLVGGYITHVPIQYMRSAFLTKNRALPDDHQWEVYGDDEAALKDNEPNAWASNNLFGNLVLAVGWQGYTFGIKDEWMQKLPKRFTKPVCADD